jgi:hypothetical protein
MTLHEIEETLTTLASRHERLDESMLVTLLRAGGWEEKDIQDAKTLFKGGVSSSFVPTEPAPALPDGVDPSHLLMEHNEDAPLVVEERTSEPISLIKEAPVPSVKKKEELPHNLPLRPFETSEHVWPFSRYKDIFYGDTEEPHDVVPEVSPMVEPVSPKPVSIPAAERKEPVVLVAVPPTPPVEPVFVPRPAAPQAVVEAHEGGENKLVVLASFMLFAILLLLGYMYQNGRL